MLEFDIYLYLLEFGFYDLFEVICFDISVVKLCNGNFVMVIVIDFEYGEECWVSYNG